MFIVLSFFWTIDLSIFTTRGLLKRALRVTGIPEKITEHPKQKVVKD